MHEWIPIIGGCIGAVASGIILLVLKRWVDRKDEREKKLDKMLAEWEGRDHHKTHKAGQ